ncbi:MAG: hypothetical protein KatS3mg068_0594 [Candidatus Sericytochromatia bacterium]|nr:MAG: hypothetical protein KatS3mg068_0594 [Candidatus Sericytochromatia bacterium]
MKILIIIIFVVILSCSNNNNQVRVNPTPTSTPKSSISLPPFDPSSFVYPTPPNLDLSKYEFDLEINFIAPLPRLYLVYPDNTRTELLIPPQKFRLKGGVYGIVVFDIVTGCNKSELIQLDKNTILNYNFNDFC